jgi:Ca-activated chloride channel family protein
MVFMKLRAAIVWAGVGIVASSAGAKALPLRSAPARSIDEPPLVTAELPIGPHVTAGKTLLMDARLGHASLPRSASGETYLFASVTAADVSGSAAQPPLDLAIVVDRSGSMKGERMANALVAAGSAVDRLRDGDRVVVVSFDTQAQVVVPLTTVDTAARASIESAIRSIRIGGDTCISCGLQEARAQLDRAIRGPDRAARMLLLSDGATNHGIVDMNGLRGLATRMRERGFPITTVGLDVDFDERVMGALAAESNGNHYFVANASGLAAVFQKEFDSLVATVAGEAEVVVEPAAGVDIVEVYDRTYRRSGSGVHVPLGSFSARDEKSVLVKLRVSPERDGALPVADLKLAYRDLSDRSDARFAGSVSPVVKSDGTAQAEMDPFVRARVERSLTARVLNDANDLLNKGEFDKARAKLADRTAAVQRAQVDAKKVAPLAPAPARARSFGKDFDDQAQALEKAQQATGAAASAAPTSKARKEAPKHLEEEMRSDPFK